MIADKVRLIIDAERELKRKRPRHWLAKQVVIIAIAIMLLLMSPLWMSIPFSTSLIILACVYFWVTRSTKT